MVNWYKRQTLILIVAFTMWGRQAPQAAADDLMSEPIKCNSINTAYQEVYSFETENYYINVCQLDNEFYYHRQSKLNIDNNLLVPAQSVFRGDVFQATVGKTTYFVGIDSDRYYSSVMLNNNEIVFEPEITSGSDLPASPNLAEVSNHNSSPTDYNLSQTRDHSLSNASLELDSPEQNASAGTLICAREESAFHPHLDGWQTLIGQTAVSASKFAVNNGHNFIYDNKDPNVALITTQDGSTINLSIASNREIVERVCIESEVETR